MIKFIVPRTNLLSWMSLRISTEKTVRTPLCEHLAGMQASSRKNPDAHPSDALCLVEDLQQKAEDCGGFDLDASPEIEPREHKAM